MAHPDLEILQLIFGPMTDEPLIVAELLAIRKHISQFFLTHYIKPDKDDPDFRKSFSATLSMKSASVSS
jgi:hypothetical protein